ncbi:MAG: ABC transporter substrate-binding protein [Candidatus Cyclobacteriaceae bacterium M3_2C_046]
MNKLSILTIFLMLFISNACDNGPVEGKIYYINSYHQGYGSSDDVMTGINQILDEHQITLKTFYMDTKREPAGQAIKARVDQIRKEIRQFQPDVIIASDDNAVKHVIEPFYKGKDIPVVFCGVNWNADQYGLPAENVTGMLEVLPLGACLDTMKNYYPQARNLTVLSENTTSERKNKELLDTLFSHKGFKVNYALVDNFETWKTNFITSNMNADLIYFSTNGAIKNWDEAKAIDFIKQNIRVPVLTCDDFMMKYTVFGLTKIAEEQGEWAARTALEIIKGEDPSDIALTRNKQVQAWINPVLADSVGFNPSQELKEKSKIIDYQENL